MLGYCWSLLSYFTDWAPWLRGVLLAGIVLAVGAVHLGPLAALIGLHGDADALRLVLTLAVTCGTVSAALAEKWRIVLVSVGGQVALWCVSHYVKESSFELCALHLAGLGVVAGLCARRSDIEFGTASRAPERDYRVCDWSVFGASVVVASLVCLFVMRRRDGTADEWAYTYQAAAFAKGHLYGHAPPCASAFRNFYVFESGGRMFSQYTPGWPLFMAPFVGLGVTWLSAPVCFGVMVVGIARLARSLARSMGPGDDSTTPAVVAAAGIWAAVVAGVGMMTLINAASRYSHIFVVALYAWNLESLAQISTPGRDFKKRWPWGLTLGASAALMLATRPADGVLLGTGIAVVFVGFLVRRRVDEGARGGPRNASLVDLGTTVVAAGGFAFVGLLVLSILRLQLGVWFKTGYSIGAVIYPWAAVHNTLPAPNEWKYGLPLASGAYCWWPGSIPLALAGLVTVRGRARDIVLVFAVGFAIFIGYYETVTVARGVDWGYGPRYLLPIIVPLSVGSGLALAPMGVAARSRTLGGRVAFERGAPWVLAIVAIVSVWVSIVPLVWATVTDHTKRHAALSDAISAAHLKNAIVMFRAGITSADALDLTTNLPIDLYPNQDVLIAHEGSPDIRACLRAAFPTRTLYSATGSGDDIHFTRD